MIKILHTADWHIGNYNNGPDINGVNGRYLDICKCIDTLCATAETEKPDFILFSGDMFHQAKVWADRGLKENQTAVKYLRRLEDIAPVVVLRGTPNHDSSEQFNALKSVFNGDPKVIFITEPTAVTVYNENGKAINIAGVPGFDRGYYRARHPGLSKEEENEVFTDAIERMIMGLKASFSEEHPTVLTGHFTIMGANMESGQTALFSQFEPVVYPHTLTAADYDLVCFGHIHRPQQLDGCKNTFYSGAVSQLNFNDEGQQRGFYIHELEDDGEAVSHAFIELPTREFYTLRLRDEDIANFNAGGTLALDETEISEKIIRVLYNCTDENNKAFNRALLEKQLYGCGAYFVQEITPQKITVTVNKTGLEADNSPEENLTQYLEDKEFTPQRIGEIAELARPIISEALESNAAEKKSGIFVPVEIEVHNYRNYRDEKFSYDGIQFCTINGSNGVGKSSLFMDALIDCLFEETREGDLTGWICNDEAARSGSIKFTFKLGERTYRVTRTRAKSGKATLNLAELVDGEWTDRSCERYRDTQAEIINTVGMDSMTLKACALIMQDRYGLFLQADKEARMNILGSILGLSAYDDMENIAAACLTDTNRKIRLLSDKLKDKQAGLPDKEWLDGCISEIEKAMNGCREAITDNLFTKDEIRSRHSKCLAAEERAMSLQGKSQTLTANKTAKIALLTAQKGIVIQSDETLREEAAITVGIAEHKALLEQEKIIISNKGMYDTVTEQIAQTEKNIEQAEAAAKTARERKATIGLTKIGPLSQVLSREEELAKAHAEYETTAVKIAEMEVREPDWKALVTAETNAEAYANKLADKYGRDWETAVNEIAAYKNKVKLLEDSGCPSIENASCKFLADALEAKKLLPAAETALKQLDDEYEKARQNASEVLTAARKAVNDFPFSFDELQSLKASLRSLERDEKEYNSLEAVRCELALMNERSAELEAAIAEHTEKAEKEKQKLEELKAKLVLVKFDSGAYADLKQRIADSAIWLEREKLLPVAREKKLAAERRITELEAEIKALDTELDDNAAEIAKEKEAAQGSAELERQAATVDELIKKEQALLEEHTLKLGALKKRRENAEKALEEMELIRDEVSKLGVLAAGYEELKRAFSQDGIPHNIIRSIIPTFEATATNILGQMSGGKMSVEFITEKVLKSNSKKEVTTLDIVINDCDTGRLPYMSRSGGERVKAALSVILALAEIKSSKAGIQVGFLCIDEAPFLDADGTQAYVDALEAIRVRYPDIKVLAITHDMAFKARFPQSITIYKDENGSHVRWD